MTCSKGARRPAKARWLLVSSLPLATMLSCQADRTTALDAATNAELPATSQAMPASLRFAALQALQTAPGYDFAADQGVLSARTGTANDVARVGAEGVTLTPPDKSFSLAMHTTHVGRAETRPLGVARVHARGQEAVIERDGMQERYLAGPLGLEQSYRIVARPQGEGPLAIEVAFEGLTPQGQAKDVVTLRDENGRERAVYRDLAAVDATGRELPARMQAANGTVTLLVDDDAAAYPIVIDPLVVTQQAKLTAVGGAAGDRFGIATSLSGNTAVVGAYGKAGYTGAAYVFVRSGGLWSQQAELTASDGAANDYFGASASVSGDTILIGAYRKGTYTGGVYVFVRNGTTWSEQAKLAAGDTAQSDRFGFAVSLAGNTAIVGAHGKASTTGAAYVYVRSGTVWSQQAKLTAGDGVANDDFGAAVSQSGETALIGAFGKASLTGAAYAFVRTGTTWAQQAKFTAGDAATSDQFGTSVSLSGDTALIGAYGKGTNAGAAYAFLRSGTTWAQQAKLIASDRAAGDWFGISVGLVGDTALIGANGKTSSTGAAYEFDRSGTAWTQGAKLTANDGVAGDNFGWSVSLSADTALVGAYFKGSMTGAAYVFGLARSQGDSCTLGSECSSGFCADGVCCNTACAAGVCDACSVATGAATNGTCSLFTGTTCNDANPCTQTDTCQTGVCTGASPVTCSASDQCHTAGICSVATGVCSNPSKADGTGCNDANANTTGDVCTAGTCAGVDHCVGVTCSALDQCHTAGSCTDHATGACSNPAKANGAGCDDGTICTQTDTCQSGTCTGASPLPCSDPGACQETATCDAILGCVYATKTAGTVCRAAGCVSGQAQPAGLCDGTSAGCPGTTPVDCGSYTCESGACSATCAGCIADAYCDQGTCLPKHPQGGTCSTTANCLAGSCVDGRCCGSTCTGQCEACDVGGHEGTCWPTTGAPHGSRTACSTDSSSCGGACDGTLRTNCTYPITSCREASCEGSSNVATLGANCDGQGSCPALQTLSCAPKLCGTTACNGDCTLDTDCTDGHFCAAGVCTAKIPAGTSCGADTQCLSGVCVDGVCCETACDGQCQACNEPNQAGTCMTVAGAPRSGRAACAGTGDCQGICDGATATTCAMPDTSKTCAVGSCAAGTATAASACDGAGTCQAGMETSCGAYTCGADACKTTCTVVEDCASGYDCVGGACVVGQDAGAEAGEDAANEASADVEIDQATDAAAEATAEAGVDATTDAIAEASVDAGAENDTYEAGDFPSAALDSGCGCRVAGTTPFSGRVPAFALLALAGAAIVRRRRSSL